MIKKIAEILNNQIVPLHVETVGLDMVFYYNVEDRNLEKISEMTGNKVHDFGGGNLSVDYFDPESEMSLTFTNRKKTP